MKEQTSPSKRQFYPLRFSTPLLCVLVLGLALCAVCFALTTWQFTIFLSGDSLAAAFEWVQYALLYLASAFFTAFILSILLCARCKIAGERLVVRFGIVAVKYAIDEIESVTIVRELGRVEVLFASEKAQRLILLLRERDCNDFVRTLTEAREEIEVDFVSPDQKDKKKK